MDETRLTLLADESFAPLLPALRARLELAGQSIVPRNFSSILDEVMRQVMHKAIEGAGGTEGSVWLADQSSESLVIVYNTGPNSEKLVGRFKQPLDSGLISMVFASEQPFVENQVFRNSNQDKSLDSMLGLQTQAMIAIPFYFLEACRGVISCVQLTRTGSGRTSPSGFDAADEAIIRNAAVILGRLIDHWALRTTVGLV